MFVGRDGAGTACCQLLTAITEEMEKKGIRRRLNAFVICILLNVLL